MTRTSVPPSGVVPRATDEARRSWYRGVTSFWLRGRLTHSWIPWNRPPWVTSHSGGASMCSRPDPAVIHCVSPLVIVPPPPWLSWWSKTPSMM